MKLLVLTGTSFIIAFSGALTPGPLLAVTVEHSLKKGFRAGPLIITGHALLELALILLVIAGFGQVLQKPAVVRVLSDAGGLLLVWMGFEMVRKAGRFDIQSGPVSKHAGSASILSGIVYSASNPYWIIWWVTIGLAYITLAYPYGFPGVALFFLGHISADFLWYSLVSFSLSKGKQRISRPAYQFLIILCGLFLVGFGFRLVLTRMLCSRRNRFSSKMELTCGDLLFTNRESITTIASKSR